MSELRPGTVIAGRFRIERRLGAGAMALVYEATHLELRQKVALKFLNDQYRADPDASARFVREARAQFSLRSEHVGRVLDVARTESGEPCIVMELLLGQSLKQILDEQPRLAVRDAIAIMLQVCEGVAEAHALGIVHRDLKPANIFVTRAADGTPTVKVIDFGLAKARDHASQGSLTAADMLIGTPRYMAPEQFAGAGNARAYTDVWALGIVLYRLVTGELPFDGPHPLAIAARIRSEDPTPPSQLVPEVPDALSAVISGCLARDVTQRYQDAGALARALVEVAGTAGGLRTATRTGAVRSVVPERFAAPPPRDVGSAGSGCEELSLLGDDATEMAYGEGNDDDPISREDPTRALGSHAVVVPSGAAVDASSLATSGTSETRIATAPPPAPHARRASVIPPPPVASARAPSVRPEPMIAFGTPTFLPPPAPLPMTPRDGVPAFVPASLPQPIEDGDDLETRFSPVNVAPRDGPQRPTRPAAPSPSGGPQHAVGGRSPHVPRSHAPLPHVSLPHPVVPRTVPMAPFMPRTAPSRGPAASPTSSWPSARPPVLEELRSKIASIGPLGLVAVALFLVLLAVAIAADSGKPSKAPRQDAPGAPLRPAPTQRSLGR